jgi:hypothetical protein
VEVRFRDGDAGTGQSLLDVQTDRAGYFDFDSSFAQGREWQATCQLPDGSVVQGPFVRSYRFN